MVMMIRRPPFILSTLAVALAVTTAGAAAADAPAPTPIPVEDVRRAPAVDVSAEVLPVLSANCLACHNRTKAKAELVLETPADLLKGGEAGPAVVPKHGAESLLLKLAAHRQDPVMPPAGNKVAAANLTPGQLGLIKLWIDQGAMGDARGAGTGGAGAAGAALQWQPVPEGLRAVYALGMTQDGRFVAASRGNRVSVYSLPTRRRVAELADPQLNA